MLPLLTTAAAAVCLAIAAAPLAHSPWLYFVFSFVCHQHPDRSLMLAGMPLAVCARCTGIYLGGFVALVVGLPSRRAAILGAAALVAADWLSEAVGLRPAWMPLRFATGMLLGLACAPVFAGLRREQGGLRAA